MSPSQDRLAEVFATTLGSELASREGSRATSADGRHFFVKSHDGSAPYFAREVEGLRELRVALEGNEDLSVVKVIAFADDAPAFLLLPLIEAGRATAESDARLGRGLAALHRTTGPVFGHPEGASNFIATLPQSNRAHDDWTTFYAEERLLPLAHRTRHLLGDALFGSIEALVSHLPSLIGPSEAPSLLHGDLWGGNVVVDRRGKPVLIDPSVYFGHREMDLAMMKLFGGFAPRVFDAYEGALPRAPDHEVRVSLFQLYPLLVHVGLFGGSYVGQVAEVARGIVRRVARGRTMI